MSQDGEHKEALQMTWISLPQKVTDKAIKSFKKQLNTCIKAGQFKHSK